MAAHSALTGRAIGRVRRWSAALVLVVGMILALGIAADISAVVTVLESDGIMGDLYRFGLIAAPVIAACCFFVPKDLPVLIACLAGITFAALGAFHIGRQSVSTPTGERCPTKPYTEPMRMQDCDRTELANGASLDIDDGSLRPKAKAPDLDVTLSSGVLTPAGPGVTIARLDSTKMNDGTYPISYPGCRRPETTNPDIDLRDLDPLREAVCVRTSKGRVAILWLVDLSDVDLSAVFYLVCWKKES